MFGEEGMRLKDKERSGRPREVNREAVLHAIEANPTLTTRMLADDLGYGQTSVVRSRIEVAKDSMGSSSTYGCAEAN
jgi:transposase